MEVWEQGLVDGFWVLDGGMERHGSSWRHMRGVFLLINEVNAGELALMEWALLIEKLGMVSLAWRCLDCQEDEVSSLIV